MTPLPTIFVHIISYRDPELPKTIEDCLAKAKFPHRVEFGVCWQHGEDETPQSAFGPYRKRVRAIIDVPAKNALGCCWARAHSQALYDGEDYVLQLDSHHRFEPGWDETLIEMMRQTGAEKPAITSYAGSYEADNTKNDCVPWVMTPKPFSPDGSLQFVPKRITDWQTRTSPVPARFASGHFFFTLGRHCTEIPYDPDLYFLGEELIMAARSWTHGYDLFHPHRLVVWHQYHRRGRPKIWEDAPDTHRSRDKVSKDRVLKIMGQAENLCDVGPYGLGNVRTLAAYERFVGIDFKNRLIHQEAFDGVAPPTTWKDEQTWYASLMREYTVSVTWPDGKVEQPVDTRFIAYIIEDAAGKVLWRQDVHEAEGFAPDPVAKFLSATAPARLIVWLNLKNLQWWKRRFAFTLTPSTFYATS